MSGSNSQHQPFNAVGSERLLHLGAGRLIARSATYRLEACFCVPQ